MNDEKPEQDDSPYRTVISLYSGRGPSPPVSFDSK